MISRAADPERARARHGGGRARTDPSAGRRWRCCSRRRSTRRALDPGYIKGYPPGIRENGGQYTHAALWSVMAFAKLGEGDKAAELFSLLNPINHARTRADVHRYKVEPYVVAADVYAVAPHVGRGGWTWYTGSAGWMQRAGIESILGLRVLGQSLRIDPCIPKAWPGFEILFRYRSARYDIRVENPRGVSTWRCACRTGRQGADRRPHAVSAGGRRRNPSDQGRAGMIRDLRRAPKCSPNRWRRVRWLPR